ncbi:MAG: apolipoprotein N-acyltransferase [Nocardioides sp.]
MHPPRAALGAIALAAGGIVSAAFAPAAFPPAAAIGVALFVLVNRGLTARAAIVPGLAFGLGFQLALLGWMRAIGADAWLTLSVLEALFFVPLGSAFAVLGRHRWWPVTCATAWVAVELWRSSWPFGGLPWGRLGFASLDTPVAAWLPYVGVTGATGVWALLGTTGAWFALNVRQPNTNTPVAPQGAARGRTHRRQIARSLAVTVTVVMLAMLPSLLTRQVTPGGRLTVAAIQGDVPGDGTDVLFDHRQVTANHVNATVQLADRVADGTVRKPDLVIWPENSTAVDPFLDAGVNAAIADASKAIDTPILVGAIVQGVNPDEVLNQGIVWSPGIGGADRYTKRHPVAYGEYIPFREQLPFSANFGRLREIGRDMLAGTRTTPLSAAGARVAAAICFDVAYDDGIYDQVRQGSDLLVVQTSNAMFVNTPQLEQQFAISRVRALETGKYVVVAATNGVSGIIDNHGVVRQRAAVRTQDALVATVPLLRDRPPSVRIGPALGWLCWAITLLGLGLASNPRSIARGIARSETPVATPPVSSTS